MTHSKEAVLAELARRELERRKCRTHPAELLKHVECIDAKTGERFEFHLHDETHGWYWQRKVLDWVLENQMCMTLKARQLGITWLACGLALWILLTKPGARVLAVSINESEAGKLVNRLWDMYQSLPEWLRYGTTVLKPAKGARPNTEIQLQHPDGRVSTIIGLPSTPKAGHGETAALVILDEFSRQEYARETWKAVYATVADGAKTMVLVISTANGVSNELTGDGNMFHHLWVNAGKLYSGLRTKFLGWQMHPDRDQAWYDNLSLPAHDKAEQYPDNQDEAFVLSGQLYFDKDALAWYSKHATRREPLYRFDFKTVGDPRHAKLLKSPEGMVSVYREPETGHDYALAADVATGRGLDQSAAYVVDLASMALCAEFHGKLDEDLFATQLHFLGKWFNTARLAVETGGGYGNAVIIPLRDGKDGRPPYPRLYRYREETSPELKERRNYGFPMTTVTRPLVISGLEKALREHSLPWVTESLMNELRTFVHKPTNPSPRAQDGTNDDCVMAAAIALELYRRFGHHPDRPARKPSKPKPHWLSLGNKKAAATVDLSRYPKN